MPDHDYVFRQIEFVEAIFVGHLTSSDHWFQRKCLNWYRRETDHSQLDILTDQVGFSYFCRSPGDSFEF